MQGGGETAATWDEVLQWARAGLPGDARAASGHLAVLQWARENGCPWDEDTCT